MKTKHNPKSGELIVAFLDGNINEDEIKYVIYSICWDKELAEILSLSEFIDRVRNNEEKRINPMSALIASNSNNLYSFECEAFILQRLNYNKDHWSFLEKAKANKWVRKEESTFHHVGKLVELKRLYIERKYDTIIEELENAVKSGKQLIVIINKKLLKDKSENKGSFFHAIYVTCIEEGDVEYLNLNILLEERIENKEFFRVWNVFSNYRVIASIVSNNYNQQPIDVNDIDLNDRLEELTEAIVDNDHDIWVRACMEEGWTYGPIRNYELKQQPDLVSYSHLSETSKEYDRLMAMNTTHLVKQL